MAAQEERPAVKALVIDSGDTLSGLAGVRALGRAGWDVGVASPAPPPYSSASRFASAWHQIPEVDRGADAVIDALATITRGRGYEVLFPAGDAEAITISFGRSRLSATVPYADHPIVMRLLDKLELTRLADDVGIASPTLLDREAATSAGKKVVVKSRLHWNPEVVGHPPRLEPSFPQGAEVAASIDAIERAGGEAITQELVTGRLMAVSLVADKRSNVRGIVQQTTEGAWPSAAGISLRARTTAIDRGLADRLAELVSALGWFGLVEFQFMQPKSGPPLLIDANARLYGSLSLAVRSGVNLPAIWGDLALDRPPREGSSRPGVRYQWLQGDIVRALDERNGGLLRDLIGCFRYAIGALSPIWQKGDHRPTIRYFARLISRHLRKLTRRSGAR